MFVCAQAWAAPGTPLWTDSFDPLVGDSSADYVATTGNMAYVAGAGPFRNSPGSNADIRVRAYAVKGGALLWEDVWDASGIHQDDEVTGLAVAGSRVFIAGSSGTNTVDHNAMVVRAYNAHNGQVLWEDQCGQFSSRARAIVTDGSRVYLAGTCSSAQNGTGLVRAYTNTGTQVWQANDIAFPADVAVNGNQVFVTGADAAGALVLHAYSANHGKLLWKIRPAAAQTLSLRSAHVVADGSMVYLAWEAADGSGLVTDQIVAYASNGKSRWQVNPGDTVNDLVLTSNGLFVAQQGSHRLVSAYDVRTGKLQWQDQPGTPTAPQSALAIAAGDNQVLVSGQAFDPAVENEPHFMVRAYGLNGKLLWEDETPTKTVQGAGANDVAWADGIAIAGGMDSRSEPPFGTTHWLVRAYSAAAPPRMCLRP